MDSLTMIHETDILQILRREKHKVRKELQRSEQKMSEETRTLFAPVPPVGSNSFRAWPATAWPSTKVYV